jgi:hypothetical protein
MVTTGQDNTTKIWSDLEKWKAERVMNELYRIRT